MALTPEAILTSSPPPEGDWLGRVDTLGGKGFRPFDRNPGVPSLADIAHGLAFTYRSGGHQAPGVTIAEHAVLASVLASSLWPHKEEVAKAALLHDSCEAYLHDMQFPIRHLITVNVEGTSMTWDENDHRLNRHIGGFFGLAPEIFDDPHVHAVDKLAAAFEQRDCRQGVRHWRVPVIPEQVAHLAMRFQPPRGAKHLFLKRAEQLGVRFTPPGA